MREDIYHLPQPPKHLPFRVEICGISYCDGSYRIQRTAASNTFVFEYIRYGRGYLRVNQEDFTPVAGDMYIAPANTDHYYGSSSDEPWEKLWFNVSGQLVRNLVNAFGMNGVCLVRSFPVEHLFLEGLEIGRRRSEEAHAEIAVIIHRILAAASAHLAALPEMRQSESGMAMKRYLDTNLTRPVCLDDLCRLIKKSPAQMLRIFRHDWGCTPYDYLLEQRLLLARQYLENTMKTNKEIAVELGFSDEYYFSSLFRRKVGISPRFYRNRLRRQE